MHRSPGSSDIHAAGLGLMLFCTESLRDLQYGHDYSDAFAKGGRLSDLVEGQRIVFLGTGSPQINYRVLLDSAGVSLATQFGCVAFGMKVGTSGVTVRDGYAVLEWRNDDAEVRLSVPPGYYRVEATWRRCDDRDVDMLIVLKLAASPSLVHGDGWPYVEYRVDHDKDAAGGPST